MNASRSLSQSVHVSLAFRYWNSQWSHEENLRRYGALASEEGLGGNWRVEIGRDDAREEELAPQLLRIKALIDHRRLFSDLEEFHLKPSTLENVTAFLAKPLFAQDPAWTFLTIFESERVSCTVDRRHGMELRLKVLNLELTLAGLLDESGLMTSREQVTQTVINLHAKCGSVEASSEIEWAQNLLNQIERSVPGLKSLRVDLGRGRYILVFSNTGDKNDVSS